MSGGGLEDGFHVRRIEVVTNEARFILADFGLAVDANHDGSIEPMKKAAALTGTSGFRSAVVDGSGGLGGFRSALDVRADDPGEDQEHDHHRCLDKAFVAFHLNPFQSVT